jgi:hypothetical protein
VEIFTPTPTTPHLFNHGIDEHIKKSSACYPMLVSGKGKSTPDI